jgi:hypothetical protein
MGGLPDWFYHAGMRWEWSVGRPTDVLIELTRGGENEYVVPVPLSGWLAFELSAARRAKAWLAAVLAKQKQSAARRQTAAQGKSAATRKALSGTGRGVQQVA